jgi:hypothetical protein
MHCESNDWRNITSGVDLPIEGFYADQPYVAQADDGSLVLVCTLGPDPEGESGQHIVSTRSEDGGKTWSKTQPIEPGDGPEASWAVLFKCPSGRLYTFYTHNTDNIREVIGSKDYYPGGICRRMDSLGHFVFKYSDDHGVTWSEQRYDINVREFEIDRKNPYTGKIRFFWNVGKPFIDCGKVYVPLYKVGGFGEGFFTSSEAVLLCSENLAFEKDPEKISFTTLPDGDVGIKAPDGGGPIAEEHSFVVLSDGSFFTVYRTVAGYPACSYSRDKGRTWSKPVYLTYADGRRVKNPRAANFIWKLSGGRYLYWFHNHGGPFVANSEQQAPPVGPYSDRNPAWCLTAREVDGPDGKHLEFSEPEVLCYEDDVMIRISYPDCIELADEIYITETDKHNARIHCLPKTFIDKIFARTVAEVKHEKPLLFQEKGGCEVPMPKLPAFRMRGPGDYRSHDLRQGFAITFNVCADNNETLLLDNRTQSGRGWALWITQQGALRLQLSDLQTTTLHTSQPKLIAPGQTHSVGIVVDGGPKVVSFVVDGRFCDGGIHQQFGWSRFSASLKDVDGHPLLRVSEAVHLLRIFKRPLLTCEVVEMSK